VHGARLARGRPQAGPPATRGAERATGQGAGSWQAWPEADVGTFVFPLAAARPLIPHQEHAPRAIGLLSSSGLEASTLGSPGRILPQTPAPVLSLPSVRTPLGAHVSPGLRVTSAQDLRQGAEDLLPCVTGEISSRARPPLLPMTRNEARQQDEHGQSRFLHRIQGFEGCVPPDGLPVHRSHVRPGHCDGIGVDQGNPEAQCRERKLEPGGQFQRYSGVPPTDGISRRRR
jgi:hypothetical protein